MIPLRRSSKSSKYKAVKTIIDGIKFDSKKEAQRYLELKTLQSLNYITGLQLQVKYDLIVNKIKICKYIADFKYFEKGSVIVEDCKGVLTPIYKLKKKLMKAIYNIDILET